jgi:hypothetical protein
MLLGSGPFVFVDQITTSTSILMLLGFWAFLLLLIKLQQLFVVLWASGQSTLLMIKLQQLLRWVGGVFLWVCFCKQLVLQWAEFFTKIGVQKLLDFQK